MIRRHAGIHYYSHRGRKAHEATFISHVGSGLVLPLVLVFVAVVVATGAVIIPWEHSNQMGPLLWALMLSTGRLLVAFVLALLCGVALGLLAEKGRHTEALLLPIFDVLESMPVLAFFPIIILFFIRADFIEGAAIFIIFFSMVWNIAFSVVSGLKQTPSEVRAVGRVFELSPWERFQRILLPALFPSLLTGSILSVADGWNILIVAEALHAYAPVSANAHDLNGIGSILVAVSSNGDISTLTLAMGLLVVSIALTNIVLWQPLLAYAKRFSFE